MNSSYIENDFGKLIEEYVFAWQPNSLVELGVLDGYSTLHIAKGIQRLEKLRHFTPKFDAYDLFEDYEFKHGKKEEVIKLLEENNVNKFVNLQKSNAYEVYKNYPDLTFNKNGDPEIHGIEFLHIDISNTGKVIKDLIELWHPKIGWRGLVLIEGGSEERDNIEWMKKYNMPSIKKEIATNPIINKYYMYATYYKFPSLTVLLKKWWNE
jgi:hypothetical protein